ncbi:fatty acid-binding protein, liver-type-like [Salvelinus namaycush]|uniref:Fatty acid-binding protein, liver-type-like n=1 Tax=Salvelinus namaycush TaxID=8040 RepID=A0A8U1BKW6_SALNM|nr:fatty acid-binding protein, liver-type-like [Salvelinus namaycush]XP_038859201.1 fatty acid-binding protein, liver-type-like [Salvelinus namaycush]XP_038859387.1 fatty acid-binding protein, liver-type-like [Salvelinus namaycush]
MSFSGKYQMETHENFESFMEAIGLPDELIQEGKDIKSISEIEQTGDHFKMTVTTGTRILTNSFTIGQETELESPTGEKVTSVVMREGNKLTSLINGIEYVTELIDTNILVNTMTLAGISYKRTSKRI